MKTSWDIKGGTTPILSFNIAADASIHVQSGAFMSGGTNVKGEKVKQDGAQKVGLFKRWRSGDFITWEYKNHAKSAQTLDVSPNGAGHLTALSFADYPEGFLVENGGFFAMSDGLCEISTQSTKQLRKSGAIAGVLSQGFTMQKLKPIEGTIGEDPTLFLESSGALIQHELKEGEELKVNKKALFGFSAGTEMELKKVEGSRLRHAWAGEGFSNYVAKGPGLVLVESHARSSASRQSDRSPSTIFWGVIGAIGIGLVNIYFAADESANGKGLEAEERLGNTVIEWIWGSDDDVQTVPNAPQND